MISVSVYLLIQCIFTSQERQIKLLKYWECEMNRDPSTLNMLYFKMTSKGCAIVTLIGLLTLTKSKYFSILTQDQFNQEKTLMILCSSGRNFRSLIYYKGRKGSSDAVSQTKPSSACKDARRRARRRTELEERKNRQNRWSRPQKTTNGYLIGVVFLLEALWELILIAERWAKLRTQKDDLRKIS